MNEISFTITGRNRADCDRVAENYLFLFFDGEPPLSIVSDVDYILHLRIDEQPRAWAGKYTYHWSEEE